MRNHLARKTLLASKGTVLHWMMAIVGSLVVLSVFMLVFGVTRATAQTGQDPRCSEFRRQAHGLCTAAVSEGCFDGDDSQECVDLTTNWNERCKLCEGQPPWEPLVEAICPCVEQVGSASSLHAEYERLTIEEVVATTCEDNEALTRVSSFTLPATYPFFTIYTYDDHELGPLCDYTLVDADGNVLLFAGVLFTSPDELEACREDIRSLMEQIDCP